MSNILEFFVQNAMFQYNLFYIIITVFDIQSMKGEICWFIQNLNPFL